MIGTLNDLAPFLVLITIVTSFVSGYYLRKGEERGKRIQEEKRCS